MTGKRRPHIRFVIFFRSQIQAESGPKYLAKNGAFTNIRRHANTFYTLEDAKNFADRNHISLDVQTYIGQDHFSDLELWG